MLETITHTKHENANERVQRIAWEPSAEGCLRGAAYDLMHCTHSPPQTHTFVFVFRVSCSCYMLCICIRTYWLPQEFCAQTCVRKFASLAFLVLSVEVASACLDAGDDSANTKHEHENAN